MKLCARSNGRGCVLEKIEPWIDLGHQRRMIYDPATNRFDLSELTLETLFRALCRVPRFSGILECNHTVGAHSYFVARQAMFTAQREGSDPDTVKFAGRLGLLHDAHEMIMGDLATPFKRNFPLDFVKAYRGLCERFDVAAKERFGLWDGLLITAKEMSFAAYCVRRSDDFAAKWEGLEMIPGGPYEGWADRWGPDMFIYPDFWKDRANDFEAFMEGEIGLCDLTRLANEVGLKP